MSLFISKSFFSKTVALGLVFSLSANNCFGQTFPAGNTDISQGSQAPSSAQGLNNSATNPALQSQLLQSIQNQPGLLPVQQNPLFGNASAMQQSLQGNYVRSKPGSSAKVTVQTDFEKYVESVTGQKMQLYGADLIKDGDQAFSPSSSAAIPRDYIISTGDEIYVRIWGNVDGDLRVVVDRQGNIGIPKVGTVKVGGLPFENLNKAIEGAIGRTISGANVEASLGKLGGIRVFVTGFAEVPGAYTVNNLSSLGNVVMAAGGPSQGGSFRNIQLIRNGKVVSNFDLYDLLLRGNKSGDLPVTAGDVINIGPAGSLVAILGAVNKKAIYEIKPGDKLDDILEYAGGFASGAANNSLNAMGLSERRKGFSEISVDKFSNYFSKDGDIYYAVSRALINQPITDQSRMVVVDGEVNNPGVYLLGSTQTLQDAVMAAGGFTSGAYLYGTRVERISVKIEQTKALERYKSEAKKLIANDSLRKQTSSEDAQLAAAYRDRMQSVLAALYEFKPDGRLVLGLGFDAKQLPPFLVETGDVITVPSAPNNVTVVGSIPSGQISLAYKPNQNLGDYINAAGGFNRGADASQSYLMRASGQFTSATSSWFSSATSLPIYPGDVAYVPEEMQKSSWMKELKDWATILYQLGLGVAAIKILRQ